MAEALAAKDKRLRAVFAGMQSAGATQEELDDFKDEGMKNFIRRVDVFAAVALRNLGMKAASRLVDSADRTEKTSAAFAEIEAPALARLFAPDMP